MDSYCKQKKPSAVRYIALSSVGVTALLTSSLPLAALADATPACDPYQTYSCLNASLGDGFWERLYNYYKLEMGHEAAPSDPNAPGAREGWPATPESTPPMPFTEWPYGGTTSLGVNHTATIDSPLMTALGNSRAGAWMNDHGLQIYGWVDPGFNVSSNSLRPGGNAPIAYAYTPNTVQLDQAVLYAERTPDTVQTDHIDWGFRLAGIYGENYRYTTSYGLAAIIHRYLHKYSVIMPFSRFGCFFGEEASAPDFAVG